MNKQFIYSLVFVSLTSVTTGCSTTPSVKEFQKYIEDPQALRVAAQICVPDMATYFDTVTVDVTDFPANISIQARQELFQKINTYEAGEKFKNPYRSDSTIREYETTRLWRKPVNPTDYPQYFIGGQTVKNVKGILTAGSISGYLKDSTEKSQPVFLEYVGERLGDVLAVSVTPPKGEAGERREFWFKLPKEIRKDKYTDWMSPVSEEGNKEHSAKFPTFWLLTHGKEMPIYEVKEKNTPKVRYILMSQDEYVKTLDYGGRARYALALQRMENNPSDKEHHYYVPDKREKIPPC